MMVSMAKILGGVNATLVASPSLRLRMALRLSRRVACPCLERAWAPHHNQRSLSRLP